MKYLVIMMIFFTPFANAELIINDGEKQERIYFDEAKGFCHSVPVYSEINGPQKDVEIVCTNGLEG